MLLVFSAGIRNDFDLYSTHGKALDLQRFIRVHAKTEPDHLLKTISIVRSLADPGHAADIRQSLILEK